MSKRLGIILTFDAAHHLPEYDGDCSRIHGHTWKIIVEFDYEQVNKIGIATDFKLLKKKIKGLLPDHQYLNSFYGDGFRPTCENLCEKFFHEITGNYALWWPEGNVQLYSVKLYESESSYVEIIQD